MTDRETAADAEKIPIIMSLCFMFFLCCRNQNVLIAVV